MTWGEQTDVPESADWYNAGFLMLWGSNVPQTRTPDAHFYTEARYKGAKSVVISPGLRRGDQIRRSLAASASKAPTRRWRWRWATSSCANSISIGSARISRTTSRQYTRLPMLVRLVQQGRRYVPERLLRAADFADTLGEANNPEWKTVAL